MYANIDIDNAIGTNSVVHQEIYRNPEMSNQDSVEAAEEHILPDSFDEVQIHEDNKSRNEKSSVSPSSRKSASSHASRGSQDSGIGIPVKQTNIVNNNNNNSSNIGETGDNNVNRSTGNTVVMQVGVATSSGHTSNKMKHVDFNKAWYDVPSDDETEAPEADSLASIISHRGSSDDEN